MSNPVVIRLDRSKPFSECRGDRQPDDPHYRVAYWQGRKVGGSMITLPFDANGVLVPDDGSTDTRVGIVDGKQITYFPLYNKAMRDLLESMKKRAETTAAKPAASDDDAEGEEDEDNTSTDPSDEVNFVSWLKGEQRYKPHLLRAAYKKRYSKVAKDNKEMVVDLVLDERLVPEDQLAPEFKAMLPKSVAA